MNALLHAESITVGYGRSTVASGIDLSLYPAEMVVLIGVNGSGKSTLLRTLAGLRSPLAGTLRMGDRAMEELSAIDRARRVAVVLTGRPQVGLMDVRSLVALGRQPWTGHFGRLSTLDRQKVESAMELTGTLEFGSRRVDTLSDGERQKVMVARALAQDTSLLLLDEPTAFLDLVNRVQVLRLLGRIAHDLGKAVLLSTHDLRAAMDLADRLALISDGRLWVGTPNEAIASGVLAEAFQSDGLHFDPITRDLH